ncbi:hypothetical protein GGR77_003828 [Xanthomonas translucens]
MAAASGASLGHSVQWLLPYLRGDKTHAEFLGSDVAFDKARSRNGEAGHVVGSAYIPRDALPLLSLTAAYDPHSARLATQLGGSTADLRLALSLLQKQALSVPNRRLVDQGASEGPAWLGRRMAAALCQA